MTTDPIFRIGITGHRAAHAAWRQNGKELGDTLGRVMALIATSCGTARTPQNGRHQVELVSLLADGADSLAASIAETYSIAVRGILPFGTQLTASLATESLPSGIRRPDDDGLFFPQESAASLLALADNDAAIVAAHAAARAAPEDKAAGARFDDLASRRFAAAAGLMIAQSDVIIAVWDGVSRSLVGGTGHTITSALELGVPVVLIHTSQPTAWRVLRSIGDAAAHACGPNGNAEDELRSLIDDLLLPAIESRQDMRGTRDSSSPLPWVERFSLWRIYAGMIWFFGGTKPRPGALTRSADVLPGVALHPALGAVLDPAFSRIDVNATYLSHAYRGSMILNFLLSLLAVTLAIIYLPAGLSMHKHFFVGGELAVLLAIVFIVATGTWRNWHGRWFAARRTAELVRHNRYLLPLAAMRPFAQWVHGPGGRSPEWRALQLLRRAGLPAGELDRERLRQALALLHGHIESQAQYHAGKSAELDRTQARLDSISLLGFCGAALVAVVYLTLSATTGVAPLMSAVFTFLAVIFPMVASTSAGVRYFADLNRFAEVSRTAEGQMRASAAAIQRSLEGGEIDHELAVFLAHQAERALMGELEAWQALFASKTIALPG